MRAANVAPVLSLIAAIGCGGSGKKGGSVQITASGELLAVEGYGFPPATPADPAFVDGWEIRFDELLVTFDNVTFSENPDMSPSDQSLTGRLVAKVTGPWAVDLAKGGPLVGKAGGAERAYPLATIDNQNLNGNKAFDETVRYAFGYDVVPATNSARKLNLDATGTADYATMVQNGWTALFVGTATWNGGTSCTQSAQYNFSQLPTTVKFRFGFVSPATYINCQNGDNDPARPFQGEDHQRGVQIKANEPNIAQITFHTDHPFWESFVHDTPAHFDQLAARAQPQGGTAPPLVTLDNVAGVDYTFFRDSAGQPLPWRSCLPSYALPSGAAMRFDSLGIPYDPSPSADPTHVMRGYRDFMTYNESTAGHLNVENGLCFTKRNYPSPQ